MTNTPAQTAIRYLVFKEDNAWYAVALELGIVVDGETPEETLLSLFEAINGVIAVQVDPKYTGKTFYQPEIDPEYEALWEQAQAGKRPIKSPYQIYTTGLRQVA